jgi:hypothetical protein
MECQQGMLAAAAPRSQGPAKDAVWAQAQAHAEAMLPAAAVVAEAASGLRLNISNDGWHAVDLWEKQQRV